MARPTIEVPWAGMVFPQKCASCSNPMVERTVAIKSLTQAAQRRQATGHALGGIIGMAIAGAASRGADKYVQYGVPYCQECAAKERQLRIIGWILFALGLAAILVLPPLAADTSMRNPSGTNWIIPSILPGIALLVGSVVVFFMFSTRRAVTIKMVKDKFNGAILSFRSLEYLDEFRQSNLPGLIAYELQAGLPLSAPPEQALDIVSRHIDDNRPDAPDTLTGHFYRAQIYMRGEAYSQAVDDLNKIAAVGGSNPLMTDVYFLRGQSLLNLSRYPEAAADLDAFVRASPDRQKVGEAKKLLKKASAYYQ